MTDYPFYTWETFRTALDEYLSSQHYSKIYPKYAEQHEMGGGIEVKIVEELLKSGDPQEGLDIFVSTVLYTGRYADNIKDYIPAIIRLFTEAGAKPDVDSLFELQNPDDERFEDEVSYYKHRGWFIDVYDKHGFDMRKYYDWSSIKATYWEDIDEEIINEDYEKACFMALKFYSACLSKNNYIV
jgi:hypothetical protein